MQNPLQSTCFGSVLLTSSQGEVADFISRTLTIATLVVLPFILQLLEESSQKRY